MRLYSSQRVSAAEHEGPSDADADAAAARLGALLVSRNILRPEQAEHVARAQRGSGTRFGETAVALGFARQSDVDAALASQFNFAVAPIDGEIDESIVTAHGQRDRASELVRGLRAKLWQRVCALGDAAADTMVPAVTVASLTGAVGRRLIASNLAVASAQAGISTLLIDADMRRPMLHRLFRTADDGGLSTFLAGRQARPRVERIRSIAGLSFLPAGPIPPNPAELLARFATLLPQLRAAAGADLVLINAPPLDDAEDLYLIAAAAPAVLMVARRHFTRARGLATAAERLRQSGATMIGSVLNVA